MNKEEPKVLNRMRLSCFCCCWGDNLNEKELNEVVDYINYLQQENKQLKDNWNKLKEYLLNGVASNNYIITENCMLSKMKELEKGDSNGQ